MSSRAQDVGDQGIQGPSLIRPLYSRPMPGGGHVRVELLVSEPATVAAEGLRGRVVMERRSFAPPSPDDEELVVEEIQGADANAVVAELFRIARDNVAIARRVLRKQGATLHAE